MDKFFCFIFNHKYFLIKEFSTGHRKVGCSRCNKSWGMHDATMSLIPWDSDLDNLTKDEYL